MELTTKYKNALLFPLMNWWANAAVLFKKLMKDLKQKR